MSDTGEQSGAERDTESDGRADDADHAESEDRRDVDHAAHLDNLDDGCGCAEVWEHLSDERDE